MTFDVAKFSDESRFESFKSMISDVRQDANDFERFNREVTTPKALVSYAAARGVNITEPESEHVFEAAEAYHVSQVQASGSDDALDDSALAGVNGGVSWAAVGGAALGITGAILGTAAAIITAPVSIPLGAVAGTAALIGVGVAGAGAGAFSGAATGALIGGASQFVSNQIGGEG